MTHKIREVYIVHHSHTDVGYTDLQEQVIYNQANNIRRAVELIENGIKNNTTQKFSSTGERSWRPSTTGAKRRWKGMCGSWPSPARTAAPAAAPMCCGAGRWDW